MSTAEIKVEDLQIEVSYLNEKIVTLTNQNRYLEEQLAWLKRQIFGQRSERIVADSNSTQMFLPGLEPITPPVEEEKKTIPAHTRRKPKRNGQDAITLPPDLPVQTTILDIPEEQKICQETGQPLVQIGVEITQKLGMVQI